MIKVQFAPLQGYTDATYRNLHNKYFGGIDKYFTPYLRFEPNKEPKKSVIRDLLAENNEGVNTVPQLLGKDINLFLEHTNKLQEQGYKELNWNLACPYPMVYKRGFGSGLLQTPEIIEEILEQILPQINVPFSVKCRLGFENENEISKLIETFNKFDLKEVIVHARTAKQMYKGEANPHIFKDVYSSSKNPLIYNGDINSVDDFKNLSNILEFEPSTIMIGRGLLKNPFLAQEINGNFIDEKEKLSVLRNFHDELFSEYEERLEKPHLLTKMQKFWEYFSFNFENQPKTHKKIKKASSIKKYNERIYEIF